MTNVGIIGMGGFAESHHGAIRSLEEAGECRLVCACDPDPEKRDAATRRLDLEGRGVKVYAGYREMLAAHRDALDVVTIPTPIPLHEPMHAACVDAGLAVYLEKPPTLDPEALERMIAREAGAAKRTQVGFNYIVEDARQGLKRRLLAGEFGRLVRVSYLGIWPRSTAYFTRNDWAGKLLGRDGNLILDSCIGNAASHCVHNLLHWAGADGFLHWAEPQSVRAALYRAHAIENFDTVFMAADLDGGAELRLAVTHACAGDTVNVETVECADATITYLTGDAYRIAWKDGRPDETGPADRRDLLIENFRAYFAYVRGEADRPLTRLEDARPFVHLLALGMVSAGAITPFRGDQVRRLPAGRPGEGEYRAAEGIRAACEAFIRTGEFPSPEEFPWAREAEPGTARPKDLSSLDDVVRGMVRG